MVGYVIFILIVALGATVFYFLRQVRDYERRIYEIEKEREVVFSFLNKIGQSITSELEVERALEFSGEFIVQETNAESGAIFVLDKSGDFLTARTVIGLFPPLTEVPDKALARPKYLHEHIKKERYAMGEGLIGNIAKSGDPVILNDAGSDPRVSRVAQSHVPINQLMAAPLRIREQLIGLMVVANKREEGGFTESDLKVLSTIGDQASVTLNLIRLYQDLAEKQRLEQEIKVAQVFQQMLLPKTFPEVTELDVWGYSQPAFEVGGDYFDIFMLDERHLGLIIADVSGKGIPGALVMAAVRSNMRAETRRIRRPREVLRQVNTDMLADTKDNVFITMTYAVIDLDKMTLCFARAGHEPLISAQTGSDNLAFHTPEGIAVGMTDDSLFSITQEAELPLHPGQMIVLYTDGVTEAMNEKGEEYGMDRFCDVIKTERDNSPRVLCEAIVENIKDFRRSAAQYDDITLIAMRARPEAFESRHGVGKVVDVGS